MNAIATRGHIDLPKEDMLPIFFLLSLGARTSYIRSFQGLLRQFKPELELELSLALRMGIALFQNDRFKTVGTGLIELRWKSTPLTVCRPG